MTVVLSIMFVVGGVLFGVVLIALVHSFLTDEGCDED